MNVLIVEDDDDIRDSLSDFCFQEGYNVVPADNGAIAVERLRDEKIDLVILDLLMPVMDGNEVYAHMQADAALRAIPVIVTTSDPTRAPAGPVVLKKPIDLGRLLEVIKDHSRSK